ncbi:hypothetical protein JXO59_09370 [candidate division KSB1 bacterium]|nr:hypothetical protein [candidate division KSB1 bacterium]
MVIPSGLDVLAINVLKYEKILIFIDFILLEWDARRCRNKFGNRESPSVLPASFTIVLALRGMCEDVIEIHTKKVICFSARIMHDIGSPTKFAKIHQNVLRLMHKIIKFLYENKEISCITRKLHYEEKQKAIVL